MQSQNFVKEVRHVFARWRLGLEKIEIGVYEHSYEIGVYKSMRT